MSKTKSTAATKALFTPTLQALLLASTQPDRERLMASQHDMTVAEIEADNFAWDAAVEADLITISTVDDRAMLRPDGRAMLALAFAELSAAMVKVTKRGY